MAKARKTQAVVAPVVAQTEVAVQQEVAAVAAPTEPAVVITPEIRVAAKPTVGRTPGTVYSATGKYNPRPNNKQTNDYTSSQWAKIQATLVANGGQVTMAQFNAAGVKSDMVLYAVRRGGLVVVPVAQ